MSTLYQIQPRSTETQVSEAEQAVPESAMQHPLGMTQNVQAPPQLLPVFPEVSSRLSSLSYNASSPNSPCVFLARNALVHCLGVWPPPSTPMAPSTVTYRANRGLGEKQQPHTCPSWICQTLPVKGEVGSVIPAVKSPTFPNLHGQLAFLSKSNKGYGLVC